MKINLEEIRKEVTFKTSRSGGSGGQNVNKVETKVILLWSVKDSNLFSDIQKNKIISRLGHRMNAIGLVRLESSETRSQLFNKEIATERLVDLIGNALAPEKKRIPTKISRAKVLARLDQKAKQSDKKARRNWRADEK